jgi:sugar phosphate isomerase/epimerase
MQNIRENTGSRLAVCSWSLQPANPDQLVEQLKAIGISRVQLALGPLREQPQVWGKTSELFARNKIEIVSGMISTVGEDYSTPQTIRLTGGIVPDQHWKQNWKNIQADAVLAAKLGIKLVTFHAGFLPHGERDPTFAKLLDRIARIADLFATKNLTLGFETGQETAETLSLFLQKLGRRNVGVNFDPANMILYDRGDPVAALHALRPWLVQCHLKDATKTKVPGTWGAEVAVGTGEVDWRSFFKTLGELNFNGWLCIEREAGDQRVADIRTAKQFVDLLSA